MKVSTNFEVDGYDRPLSS